MQSAHLHFKGVLVSFSKSKVETNYCFASIGHVMQVMLCMKWKAFCIPAQWRKPAKEAHRVYCHRTYQKLSLKMQNKPDYMGENAPSRLSP